MRAWMRKTKYFAVPVLINTLLALFIAIISDTRWGKEAAEQYPIITPIGIIAMLLFLLVFAASLVYLAYINFTVKKLLTH